MSGAVKAVTKVFRKVTDSVVGKIAVGVLAGYLTMGLGQMALGAMGASQGFLSSTLGTVLSGAVSGAAAGGLTSALTGGNIGKGILLGGVGGAISGGVQSYLNSSGYSTDLKGFTDPAGTGKAINPEIGPGAVRDLGAPVETLSTDAITGGVESGANALNVNPGAGAAAQSAVQYQPPVGYGEAVSGGGLINSPFEGFNPANNPEMGGSILRQQTTAGVHASASGVGPNMAVGGKSWLDTVTGAVKDNPVIAGNVIGGVASGGLQMMGASGMAEAKLEENEILRERLADNRARQAEIGASHTGQGGLLNAGSTDYMANQAPRPSPTQRFDPSTYGGSWQWDPAQQKLVFVRNGA